jgi:sugar/nucleoside kinase (ribokinase family)
MTSSAALDVLGIGNAIVDVLAHADDAFLARHGLVKGSMRLIDDVQAETIYAAMGPGIECSGGSCANTMAGVASLGGRGAYIGKVRDDQLGGVFRHDMRATGVAFDTPPSTDGAATARCLILVTPDAQRTMNTFLGACTQLGPADIDRERVRSARVTYIEGYMWDQPAAKEACRVAMDTARRGGREVALTLSDSFCVDRYRTEFLGLVRDSVDILFANEAEIKSLYETQSFDEALQRVRRDCKIAALTRSEKGSVVIEGDAVHIVDAAKVTRVVDTTGAGDMYAAGFLFGYTAGKKLGECGRIGGIAAAEVISHVGARPETPLKSLLAAA